MKYPKVYIIILNYDTYNETICYVKNLKKQKLIDLSVLIVDNCSTNNSFEILRNIFSHDKNVTVIKTKYNGGYAYGNNWGLLSIKNETNDYIIISNSDIFISNDTMIKDLITHYKKCDNVAFIAPIMLNNSKIADFPAWKIPTIFDDIIDTTFLFKTLLKKQIGYEIKDKSNIVVDCLPGVIFFGQQGYFF